MCIACLHLSYANQLRGPAEEEESNFLKRETLHFETDSASRSSPSHVESKGPTTWNSFLHGSSAHALLLRKLNVQSHYVISATSYVS